ncbi:hypothetical protein QR77_05130 [Streptomyces sp. 150FB]|uniref:hypothetical protein n=1 Tax=Streptomyces sp. 150FB TaxID=1576605 RepID=UPI0005890BA5|nr:hypothetical protein [Streptomyces sp. 150FB]KIF73517.1 hypothetical protein QR77_05130 [Streptomyces sp. 150FB]
MSETTTHIGAMNGVTHSGPGPQNIHQHFHAPGSSPAEESLAKDAQGRTPQALAKRELGWLRERFEPPEGFSEALEKLEKKGTVLLDGEAGNGRTAAAKMLLDFLPRTPGPLHEIPLDDESESSRPLNHKHIGDEDRLLLDLSRENEQCWLRVQAELPSYRKVADEREAALVVILPPRTEYTLTPEHASLRCFISRPPGMESDIIRRHLRQADPEIDPKSVDSMPVPEALGKLLSKRHPLRTIATFAEYIGTARNRGGDFDSWCTQALEASQGRSAEAGTLLGNVRKGAPRSLLVAAAMLHGARGDAIHHSAALLLDAVDPPARPRPALRHRPLSARLEELDATADAGTSRVRFTKVGLATAVRSRVWHDFPDLRGPLRDWVGKVVNVPELEDSDRDAVVSRFSEECLACRRPEDLLVLARRWSRVAGNTSARNTQQLRAATLILGCGLQHHEFGRVFREETLNWSRNAHLSSVQRKVLVEVCREYMAVTHPYLALVRLHHLARREKPETVAGTALLELTRLDHRLRRRLLARLAEAFANAAQGVGDTSTVGQDALLFLDHSAPGPLTDPGSRARSLIAESGVRKDLIAGWTAVFAGVPAQDWSFPVRAWFDAASTGAPFADRLLDILVAACAPRGDLLGALYRSSIRWAAGRPPPRSDLPDDLYRKISAAQHAHFLSAGETTTP